MLLYRSMLFVSMTLFDKLQILRCIVCSVVLFSHLWIHIEAQKLCQRKQSGALQYVALAWAGEKKQCEHFTSPSAPRCFSPCPESHRSIEKYNALKQGLPGGWKTIPELNLDLCYCRGNPKKARGSGVGKHLMWFLLYEGCKKILSNSENFYTRVMSQIFSFFVSWP